MLALSSLNLVWKYTNINIPLAWKYVQLSKRGNYLTKEGNSFSNAKLEENGELYEKRPMPNDILEGIIDKHNGCEGDFTLRILSKALKKKRNSLPSKKFSLLFHYNDKIVS